MTTPTVRPPMNKRTRFNLWFWFIALIGLFSFQSWLAVQNAVEPVPYSEFQRYLKEDDRDLIARFKELAPAYPKVSIQRWSFRRVGLIAAVLVGLAVALSWGVDAILDVLA